MAQILIVDDEIFIVESIKNSLNWETIGVDGVFTAFSMRQAKEVFENHSIEVMLCDIEMPQGSGIELLAWARENYPRTECIFLTCHADFRYAKEAIRLGCFDYILKPGQEKELEAIIAKALDKVHLDTKMKEYSAFGQFWFKHQPILIESFWMDILDHTIPSNPVVIKKEAERRNIPFSEKMMIFPVLVGVHHWHKELSVQDEKILEFGLKNIAEELLAAEGKQGRFYAIQRGCLLGILTMDGKPGLYADTLNEGCRSFIETCRKYLACDLSCYVGDKIYAHELASTVRSLLTLKKNNVALSNRVLFLNTQTVSRGVTITKDMNVWAVMLKEGSYQEIVSEAGKYLQQIALSSGLDANHLYKFQQDFSQMIYSVLEQKGVQAHQLLNDDKSLELHLQAPNSVMEMIEWIRHVLGKVQEYVTEYDQSQSVVHRAKKYIKLHLDQEMTREEIANFVYLNPDYLDRLFKRETGVSISRYIMQERLLVAQELLTKTEIPIGTIAATVGYANISKFSGMFKKMCGVSPIEYRKKNSK